MFDRSSAFFTYGTLLLSAGTLILNNYAKDLNPGAEAQKDRKAVAVERARILSESID